MRSSPRTDLPSAREVSWQSSKDTSTTLTVWHYDSAMGAAAGEIRLKDLQQQGGLVVVDAVTVTWVPGAEKPHIGHLLRQGPAAVAKGSALGVLVGTLFLAPVVGRRRRRRRGRPGAPAASLGAGP